MGNFWSNRCILDEETLLTYVELTYLERRDILCIIERFNNIHPRKLCNDLHHRFTVEQINMILPEIAYSPFKDSVYRVFSSKQDGHLSLEDVLDLCSAFSENCPDDVRAAWAFRILDLDGDNAISADDLIEIVRRLTRNHEGERESIDNAEVEHVARMVLREIVYNEVASISVEDFVHYSARMPEFFNTFHFKI